MLITRFGTISSQSGYTNITIDSSKIDATLTNYPIMVKLTPSNFDFSKVRTDGMDIAFYDLSNNLLPFEREYFLTNSQAVFHVRIPSISASADTTFKMVYGNGLSNDLSNKNAVWDANFVMVQHMGASLLDSTVNSNNGTATGTTVVDGLNGKARYFNGSGDYVTVSDSNTLDFDSHDFTLYAVHKVDTKKTNGAILTKTVATFDSSLNYALDQSTDVLRITVSDSSGTSGHSTIVENITDYQIGSYVSHVGRYMGSTKAIDCITDGINKQSGVASYNVVSNNGVLSIGAYNESPTLCFNGIIDEVRISNIARSDAWIKADDYNLRLNTLVSIT